MADNDGFDYSNDEGEGRPRDVVGGKDRRDEDGGNEGGGRKDRGREKWDGGGSDKGGRDDRDRRDRDGRDGDESDSGRDPDENRRDGGRRDRDRRDRDTHDGGRRDRDRRDRDRRGRDRRGRDRRDEDGSDSERERDRDRRRSKDRRDSRERRPRNRDSRHGDDDRDSRYSDKSRDRHSSSGRDRDKGGRYTDDYDDNYARDRYSGRPKGRNQRDRSRDSYRDRDRSRDSYRDRDKSSDRQYDDRPKKRDDDDGDVGDRYAQVRKNEERDEERSKGIDIDRGINDERDRERMPERGSEDGRRNPDVDESTGENYREMYVGDKDQDYARLKRGSNYDQDYPDGDRGRYKPPKGHMMTIPNIDQRDSRQHHEGIYDFPRDMTSSNDRNQREGKKDWKMILSPARLMTKLRRKKDDDDVNKPDPMTRPPEHHAHPEERKDSSGKAKGEDDERKLVYGEDENEDRGNWTGKYDFILSLLGTAVGLGNVWRFPYLCYRNGGGAFLFPFLIMMVVIGVPLFFLEAALGQFSSCGAMTCWEFAPFFKGVGVAMVMISALTGIYYNMILGWSLHYLFASFTDQLPWTTCVNEWNTKDCNQLLPEIACTKEGQAKEPTGVCTSGVGQEIGLWNLSLFEISGRKLASASEQYWDNQVLDFSSTIDDFGVPKWDLVLCLLLAWIICFFCLIKGIKTTGKVVYFTAIFPYVVLTILFFRGVTLDNAWEGIEYFITPKFERLLDANVWKDAANQIFFSMSIAGGGLITLSSYNRFHNDILRDSIIVAIGDSFTCVFGGFVIFSFLGYMAGQLDVGIEDVAADGAGLAFVVYPEAVSSLPPAPLWSVLFFFMLLTLGLDSQFAMLETVLTGVLDQCPSLRPKKTLVILSICCVLFIMGLPLTCPGGMYLLQILDNYVGGMSLIILGFVELVAIVFVYGVNRFFMDIQLMIGKTRILYWKVTWCVLSPFTVVFIFVFMFVDYKRSTYGEDYTYPVWADVFGWFVTLSVIMCIPVNMVVKVIRERDEGSLFQRIRAMCLPTLYWGPALPKHRRLVDYVDNFRIDPWQDIKPRHAYNNPAFNNKSSDTSDSSIRATPAPSHTSINMYPTGHAPAPSTPSTSSRRKSREFQYTSRSRDSYPSHRQQQHQQPSDSSSLHSLSKPRLYNNGFSNESQEPHGHNHRHRREPHQDPSQYEPHEPRDDYVQRRESQYEPREVPDRSGGPRSLDRSYTTGSANSIVIDPNHSKNSSFETIV